MKKVLIVEDEEIHKLLAVKILNELGFRSNEVYLASDGRQALDFIRICQKRGDSIPDIILLDLDMPAGNGFEFLENFNNLPLPCMPQIIITSCSTDIDEIERASKLGVYQYITKPLRKDVLQAMINSRPEIELTAVIAKD